MAERSKIIVELTREEAEALIKMTRPRMFYAFRDPLGLTEDIYVKVFAALTSTAEAEGKRDG